MPIDSSIALNLQPAKPVDYLGAYGNALTLKSLMGQQQLQGLQLQQAQREADKQMRLSDLARSSGGDIDKFLTGMAEVDPIGAYELGMKNRKTLADLAKTGAEGRKLALESKSKALELSSQIFSALGENPTPEQIMGGARYAVQNGLLDASAIPSDPAALPAWYQQKRAEGIAAEKQWAEQRARAEAARKAMEPMSELGRTLRDWRLSEQTGGEFDRYQPPVVTQGDADAETAPERTANAGRMDDLFSGAVRRQALGPADQVMQYDPATGRPIVVPEAFKAKEQLARAGATNVSVGMQAYEKKLQQNDAEEVSKARAGAETADRNAVEVRTIVDVLRGFRGGQWNVMAAKIGEFLPGTDFAKATSVNQIADSIRNRLGPTMRVAGTGAQSDFETRALMSAIPSLLTYEEGRELMARVFERAAERAAFGADLKDRMIRSENYSVTGFRKAMQEKFGKGGLLTPEELAFVNRARQSPPPEPGATAPMPKPDFNLGSMPDPAQHSGREIEATDGTRYRSDGKKWVRQPKGASGRF